MAWDENPYGWLLYLSLQPVLQLRQRKRTMGKRVLLRFVHFGVCLAFILEDGIPACVSRSVTLPPYSTSLKQNCKTTDTHTKSSRTPRRHYLPLQPHNQPTQQQLKSIYPGSLATYINPPLKNQHLMPRPLAVRKRANGLGGLIVICHEHVVKTFEAKSLEEPFSKVAYICLSKIT